MVTNADTQSLTEKIISRFFHFVAKRDLRVLAEFAPGNDVRLIGSDAGEVATGQQEISEFFTRLFASARNFSWEARSVEESRVGDIAWFFADGQMTVESAEGLKKFPYRIGGVLECVGDRWLWRQYHGSEPVASN